MTRDELFRFAFEVSRDDYVRGQGRLALVETKAQLIALTAGVFITVLVTYGVEKLPVQGPGLGLIAAMALLSLGTSLIFSLAASVFVEVRPPPEAKSTCAKCEALVGKTGAALDGAAAETLMGELSAAYALAAEELTAVLAQRTRKLKIAQIGLIFSLLLIIVWLGLPALGLAIAQFNS
jgi:hypothetical protein